MNRGSLILAFSLLAVCSVTGVASVAGFSRNVAFVDELLPRIANIAAHAPVDYGLGPGRGRPPIPPRGSVRHSDYSTPGAGGYVAGVNLTSAGSYYVMPTCAIGAPTLVPGQQASCSPFAYGLSVFPVGTSGTGYHLNDVLTMSPMPGLNCPTYPALYVSAVDSVGRIKGAAKFNLGMCSSFPATGTYSFSGGSGTGYTIPTGKNGIRWYIEFVATSGGSGYSTAPPVTFLSGAPFATATGTATFASNIQVAPTVPQGGATVATQGFFGAAVPWPINAIHMALLPDGRILNFGTDQTGQQGGALLYDIWDPTLGTGPDSHLTLPNTTSTDIFCGNSSIVGNTGQVLMTGGDLTVNGVRNYVNNKTTVFNPTANTVANGSQMQYPRWYPSIVPLPNGDKLLLGGYTTRQSEDTTNSGNAASTPEVYSPSTGWRTLTGINLTGDWYYPRGFVSPRGDVFHLEPNGTLWSITTSGAGTLQRYPSSISSSNSFLPTVMFAPGKLLAIRMTAATVIDINGPNPVMTKTANIDRLRMDAGATLLADGRILVNGGSVVHNVLAGAAYTTQIWNPANGTWTTGASATKPRLYHSSALLLPDGSVLTAGGGSPGPIVNLNAEIYYPSYLYMTDGSGQPAQRPQILSVQASGGIAAGGVLGLTMADANPVSRVTLLRFGSSTHVTNSEQRFFDVTSTLVQNGQQLSVTLPSNANNLLPGYYLVFVFNQAGVPSVAKQFLVTSPSSS